MYTSGFDNHETGIGAPAAWGRRRLLSSGWSRICTAAQHHCHVCPRRKQRPIDSTSGNATSALVHSQHADTWHVSEHVEQWERQALLGLVEERVTWGGSRLVRAKGLQEGGKYNDLQQLWRRREGTC